MQLMQQYVQKSRSTNRPRNSLSDSGVATFTHSPPSSPGAGTRRRYGFSAASFVPASAFVASVAFGVSCPIALVQFGLGQKVLRPRTVYEARRKVRRRRLFGRLEQQFFWELIATPRRWTVLVIPIVMTSFLAASVSRPRFLVCRGSKPSVQQSKSQVSAITFYPIVRLALNGSFSVLEVRQ